MKKLIKELTELLPSIYAQENKGADAIVYVHFTHPDSVWDWFCIEGEPLYNRTKPDFEFFGLVKGFECEYGYFLLSELRRVGAFRDTTFVGCTLAQVMLP